MKFCRHSYAWLSLLALALVCASLPARAQNAPQEAARAAAEQKSLPRSEVERHAEAYFNFAMGNLYEDLYEDSNRSEYASQAIEHYKKALAIDSRSSVISERLAAIYAKSQRIRDAVLEAQEILKREPDNLGARRLLARIYVRTLGEHNAGSASKETVTRAIEQYREILRVDAGDSEATLWLARLYRLQNDLEKAEDVLRAGLAHEPENEDMLRSLTLILLDRGKAEDAVALLSKVVAHSPSADLLELLGDAYVRLQDPASAEQAYRGAVEAETRDVGRRRKLAQSLFSQGKFQEALEQYRRLIESEPDEPQNYLRAAQIYRQLKRLDKAEESLLRAKQRAPNSVEVIYSEALLYEAQGRFDDAIRVLSDSVSAVKSSTDSFAEPRRTLSVLYEQLGRLYREVENYPAAVLAFREMLKLDTESEKRARAMIADTYRMGKDMPHALEESRKALELFPNDRGIQVTHALLLGESGATDESAAYLRGILKDAGHDRELYITLAQVYERGRRFDEAEQAARSAEKLAASPAENEGVWFLLGAIYERQKKYDPAEEQFKKVLQLNPRNAQVLNYLGYTLADRGIRLDESVELIQKALAEEPYNGAYLDSLGWAFYKQNRLPEAETYLRKAVERARHDPTVLEHLGDVLLSLGRVPQAAAEWEKARAEWQRALPTELESERVAALEKKLSSLKHRLAQKSAGETRPK